MGVEKVNRQTTPSPTTTVMPMLHKLSTLMISKNTPLPITKSRALMPKPSTSSTTQRVQQSAVTRLALESKQRSLSIAHQNLGISTWGLRSKSYVSYRNLALLDISYNIYYNFTMANRAEQGISLSRREFLVRSIAASGLALVAGVRIGENLQTTPEEERKRDFGTFKTYIEKYTTAGDYLKKIFPNPTDSQLKKHFEVESKRRGNETATFYRLYMPEYTGFISESNSDYIPVLRVGAINSKTTEGKIIKTININAQFDETGEKQTLLNTDTRINAVNGGIGELSRKKMVEVITGFVKDPDLRKTGGWENIDVVSDENREKSAKITKTVIKDTVTLAGTMSSNGSASLVITKGSDTPTIAIK